MSREPIARQKPSRAAQLVLVLPMTFYRLGMANQLAKRNIMLLYTTGRRTGRRRASGLNYVMDGNTVYAAAGWGPRTGWFLNSASNPTVELQIGERHVAAHARPVTDSAERAKVVQLLEAMDGLGAPRPIQALMRHLGLDLEAEQQSLLADPDNLTAMAFELAQPLASVPLARSGLPKSVLFAALGLAALIFATRRKRGRHR